MAKLRFRKSVKIAPGVKLNVGKKSVGLTVGNKYARVTTNSRAGTRASVSMPGTGMRLEQKLSSSTSSRAPRSRPAPETALPTPNTGISGTPVDELTALRDFYDEQPYPAFRAAHEGQLGGVSLPYTFVGILPLLVLGIFLPFIIHPIFFLLLVLVAFGIWHNFYWIPKRRDKAMEYYDETIEELKGFINFDKERSEELKRSLIKAKSISILEPVSNDFGILLNTDERIYKSGAAEKLRVSNDVYSVADRGLYAITNQRFIFSSATSTDSIDLSRLVSVVTQLDRLISIGLINRKTKDHYQMFGEAHLVTLYIKAFASVLRNNKARARAS